MKYRLVSWLMALAVVAGFAFSGTPASADCGYSAMPDTGPTATMLVVEAQIGEVIAERMQALRSDARQALIHSDIRRFTQLRAAYDSVTVRITNPEDVARAGELLHGLARPLGGKMIGNLDLEVTNTGDQTYRISLTEPAMTEVTDHIVQQTLEIIRRRIDEAGLRARLIQLRGDDRILIQLPGTTLDNSTLGLITRTGKLSFHEVAGVGAEPVDPGPDQILVPDAEDGTYYLLKRVPLLTGKHLADATVGSNTQTGAPMVTFRFTPRGARLFGPLTQRLVGKQLAIVMDNEVISAPRIMSPILGGAVVIEGNFTLESATELVILLRAGALPASLKVLEMITVGPAYQNGAVGSAAVLLEVQLQTGADPATMCDRLAALEMGDISIQDFFAAPLALLIWVELQDSRPPDEVAAAVMEALNGYAVLRSFDHVGPNVASGGKSVLNTILKWFD